MTLLHYAQNQLEPDEGEIENMLKHNHKVAVMVVGATVKLSEGSKE